MRMDKRLQNGIGVGILVILAALLLLLQYRKRNDASIKNTLGSLAYRNQESECLVYCKESSGYVPYLVLTDDYQGAALLLRKEVLEEERQFNDYLAYYKDSLVDQFLSTEFIKQLDPELQRWLVPTDIKISTRDSLTNCGQETEVITRKAFLLAVHEIGFDAIDFVSKEGKQLQYFKEVDHIGATCSGKPTGWWLRTSNNTSDILVYIVNIKNELRSIGADYTCGVRPAFCLPKDMKVRKTTDILSDREVYILGFDGR